jgi:hypothetical protein
VLSSSLDGDPEAAVLRPLQAHLPGTHAGTISGEDNSKGRHYTVEMELAGEGYELWAWVGEVTPPYTHHQHNVFSRFFNVAKKILNIMVHPNTY